MNTAVTTIPQDTYFLYILALCSWRNRRTFHCQVRLRIWNDERRPDVPFAPVV